MAANYVLGYTPKPYCLNLTLPPKPFVKSYQSHCFTTNNKIRAFSFLNIITTQPTKFRVNQPHNALHPFAAVTNGLLEVSDEGDDNQSKLVIDSFRMRKEYLLAKGKMAAEFLVWIPLAFSSLFALPATIVVAYLLGCIDHATGYEVMKFVRFALRNLCDKRFIGYIFSVAFGNVDHPNQGIEEKKWKMIGQYIALNGGVVTAEELAPYLDPETTDEKDCVSYLRPVLLRFFGQPIIDEEGNLLYHFPSVQCVGQCWDIEVEKFLKEDEWQYSKLSAEGIGFMKSILRYNMFSSIIVSELLRRIDGSTLFKLINGYFCVPLLRVYAIFAVVVLAIQFLRQASVETTNFYIVRRNKVREGHAKALENADHSLKQKLLSARAMAGRISTGNENLFFRRDTDLYEHHNSEKLEWDRRFNDRCDSV